MFSQTLYKSQKQKYDQTSKSTSKKHIRLQSKKQYFQNIDQFVCDNIQIPIYDIQKCQLTLQNDNNSQKLFKITNYGVDTENIHNQFYIRRQKTNINICLYIKDIHLGYKFSKLIEPIMLQVALYERQSDNTFTQITSVYQKIFQPVMKQSDDIIQFQINQNQNDVYLVVLVNKLLSRESNDITHSLYQNIQQQTHVKIQGHNSEINQYMINNLYPIHLLGCTEQNKFLQQQIIDYAAILQENEFISQKDQIFTPFALSFQKLQLQNKEMSKKYKIKFTSLKFNYRQNEAISQQIGQYLQQAVKENNSIERIEYIFPEVDFYQANDSVDDELKDKIFDRVQIDNNGCNDLLYETPNFKEQSKTQDCGCLLNQKFYVPQQITAKKIFNLQYDTPVKQLVSYKDYNLIDHKMNFGVLSFKQFSFKQLLEEHNTYKITVYAKEGLYCQNDICYKQKSELKPLLFDNNFNTFSEYTFTSVYNSNIINSWEQINVDLNTNIQTTYLEFVIYKIQTKSNSIKAKQNPIPVLTSIIQLSDLVYTSDKRQFQLYKYSKDQFSIKKEISGNIQVDFILQSNQFLQNTLNKLCKIQSGIYQTNKIQKQFQLILDYLKDVLNKSKEKEKEIIYITTHSKIILYYICYSLKNLEDENFQICLQEIFEIINILDQILDLDQSQQCINIDRQYQFYNIIVQNQNNPIDDVYQNIKQQMLSRNQAEYCQFLQYNQQYSQLINNGFKDKSKTNNDDNKETKSFLKKGRQLNKKEKQLYIQYYLRYNYIFNPISLNIDYQKPHYQKRNRLDILIDEVKMYLLQNDDDQFLSQISQRLFNYLLFGSQEINIKQIIQYLRLLYMCFNLSAQQIIEVQSKLYMIIQCQLYKEIKNRKILIEKQRRETERQVSNKIFDQQVNKILIETINDQYIELIENINLLIVKCIDQTDIEYSKQILYQIAGSKEEKQNEIYSFVKKYIDWEFSYLWFLCHSDQIKYQNVQKYLLLTIIDKLNEENGSKYFTLLRSTMLKIYQLNNDITFLNDKDCTIGSKLFDTIIQYQINNVDKIEDSAQKRTRFINGNLSLLYACAFELCDFQTLFNSKKDIDIKNITKFIEFIDTSLNLFTQRELQIQLEESIYDQCHNNSDSKYIQYKSHLLENMEKIFNKSYYVKKNKQVIDKAQPKAQQKAQSYKNKQQTRQSRFGNDIEDSTQTYDFSQDIQNTQLQPMFESLYQDIDQCAYNLFTNFMNNILQNKRIQTNIKLTYINRFDNTAFLQQKVLTQFIFEITKQIQNKLLSKENSKINLKDYSELIINEMSRKNIDTTQLFQVLTSALQNEYVENYMIQFIGYEKNDKKDSKVQQLNTIYQIFEQYFQYLLTIKNKTLQNTVLNLTQILIGSIKLFNKSDQDSDYAEQFNLMFLEFLSLTRHFEKRKDKINDLILLLKQQQKIYQKDDKTKETPYDVCLSQAYLVKIFLYLQTLVDKQEYQKIQKSIEPMTIPFQYSKYEDKYYDKDHRDKAKNDIFTVLNECRNCLCNLQLFDLYILIQNLTNYLVVKLNNLSRDYANYEEINNKYLLPCVAPQKEILYTTKYLLVCFLLRTKESLKTETYIYQLFNGQTISKDNLKSWYQYKNNGTNNQQKDNYSESQITTHKTQGNYTQYEQTEQKSEQSKTSTTNIVQNQVAASQSILSSSKNSASGSGASLQKEDSQKGQYQIQRIGNDYYDNIISQQYVTFFFNQELQRDIQPEVLYISNVNAKQFIFESNEEKYMDSTYSLTKFISTILDKGNIKYPTSGKTFNYISNQLFGNVFQSDIPLSNLDKLQIVDDSISKLVKEDKKNLSQIVIISITRNQFPCLTQRVQAYKMYIYLSPIQAKIRSILQYLNYLQEVDNINFETQEQRTQYIEATIKGLLASEVGGGLTTIQVFYSNSNYGAKFTELFGKDILQSIQLQNQFELQYQDDQMNDSTSTYPLEQQPTQPTFSTYVDNQNSFDLSNITLKPDSQLERIGSSQFYQYKYNYQQQMEQFNNLLYQTLLECKEFILSFYEANQLNINRSFYKEQFIRNVNHIIKLVGEKDKIKFQKLLNNLPEDNIE